MSPTGHQLPPGLQFSMSALPPKAAAAIRRPAYPLRAREDPEIHHQNQVAEIRVGLFLKATGSLIGTSGRWQSLLSVWLHQTGHDVYGQCEHGRVKKKRHSAVDRRQSTNRFTGNLNIGHLSGHRYHKRVV
jgi:hypothetical protein